jgi:hypothetical protein
MRFRLVKPNDFRSIAEIHYSCRKISNGFFANVSQSFLRQYYRILLDDPNSIILCVENDDKRICGFVSATLDARMQFLNLKKYSALFFLTLLPSLFMNPLLLRDAIVRFRSTQNKSLPQFISFEGARGEFWVWDSRIKNSVWAVLLYQTHLSLLATIGVERLNIEVDLDNSKLLKFHEKNGAKLASKLQVSDGRERLFMFYELNKKYSNKINF